MKDEEVLVLIKPDGLLKSLTGNILSMLSETNLKIIGAKVLKVSKELAEKHYSQLKESKPKVFDETIKYIMGEFHTPRVLALVYKGPDAIKKVRKIAGETNPEKAAPTTIRGKYGRIDTKTGLFENVVHVSDSIENAQREIQLWFNSSEIVN